MFATPCQPRPDGFFSGLLIGAAFAHEDMKGFNVLLKALPIDGGLVQRRYADAQPQKNAELVEVAKPTLKKSADQNA